MSSEETGKSVPSRSLMRCVMAFSRSYVRFIASEKRYATAAAMLACLCAGLSVVGAAYDHGHSIMALADVYGSAGKAVFVFLAEAVALFIVASLLMRAWCLFESRLTGGAMGLSSGSISCRCFLTYGGILFLVWLVWIVPHYPGTLRDDTLAQMFQWYGVVEFYTQHPVTDTLLFGAFFSLGDQLGAREAGIFIYVIVQAAATALGFSFVLCHLKRAGVPRWTVWALLAFYGCARVVYQPVDTMSKDALSAVFFAPAAILMVEVLRSEGASLKNRKKMAGLCLLVFLCIVTKRTMLYVFLVAFMAIVVWLVVARRPAGRAVMAIAMPVAAALLLWNPLMNAAAGAYHNNTYEMYSVPVQQIARTLVSHPDALNEDERDRLGEFLDSDKAVSVYNPWRSDEVNRTEVDDPNAVALVETWIKLGLRYPATYLAAFMDLTANWYGLTCPINFGHDSHEELVSEARMEAWTEEFFGDDKEAAERFFGGFSLEHPVWSQPILRVEERIDRLQAATPLLSSYGFYCFFMPLLVAVYCILRKDARGLAAASIPLALLLSFLVGPIALYWYTIPMIYIFPIIICLPVLLPTMRSYLVPSD